jgi:hypothetical protein
VRSGFTRLACALLAAGVLLSGCGGPEEVTYVDPNPAGAANGSPAPFARFGAATTERAKAAIRIRAALAAARTLSAADPDAARAVLTRTIDEDLPAIEPRVVAANPRLAAALRAGIEQLRDKPPAPGAPYTREVRRISDSLLQQAADIAVPSTARLDNAFRAGLLYETLQQAGVSYEASFEGGSTEIVDPAEYRLAYGLLVDANTRQLDALEQQDRAIAKDELERITRSSLPGPTPPKDPRRPDTVLGELTTLADDVVTAAGIDPTYPPPDPATPDQLRALKRTVAAAVEAFERGERDAARRQLASADRSQLAIASAGLAAVSPGLLAELERDVVITLPTAMSSHGDVAGTAAEVDARIDEAIQLVEEELELLREAG